MDKIFSLSLSTRVLLGLVLGVLTGLFLGEKVSFLGSVGEAFILLLQMAVLPYIVLSLTSGIGRLSYQEVLSYGKKCGLILLLIWLVTLFIIVLFPFTFPEWENASYFSTSLLDVPGEMDVFTLFIPANPFYSLANNIVPAVVLFSIAVGLALIGIENKQGLIENLTVLNTAIIRITVFVVNLAPLGVFAIMANAVGTMSVEEFGRLQVYFVAYIAFWLIITFWILPMVVTCLSPLSYRDVIWYSKDVLITAFATGNFLILLPLIASKSKALLHKCNVKAGAADVTVDIIVPTAYNFPSAGKLLSLSFILFAGWLSETSVPIGKYPVLLFAGLFSFFGHAFVAIEFLLDFLHIPSDLLNLYVISDVFISRFLVTLGTVHTLALSLIGTLAIYGAIKVNWRKLGVCCLVSALLIFCAVLLARGVSNRLLNAEYTKYTEFIERDLLHKGVPSKTTKADLIKSLSPGDLEKPRLQVIRERKSLRVGYFQDALPWVFRNKTGRLVGFDVDMAHELAEELEVDLEFVLTDRTNCVKHLNAGRCDVIMSGVAITTERIGTMAFSESYLDTTLAFIVADHRLDEFKSRTSINTIEELKIGVLNKPYFILKLKEYLPNAHLEILQSPRAFFTREEKEIDAFLFTAEAGSAWTLIYPRYSVAIPHPDIVKSPVAYAVPVKDYEMVNFMSTWVDLKKKDKAIEHFFNYWILGKDETRKNSDSP